jgi:hypothetical protein
LEGGANSYAAQRVDSSGNIVWGDGVLLHGDTTGGQFNSASDNFGNLFIVWDEKRNNPFNADQYAQKINTSGTLLWGVSGVALCTLQVAGESYPQITSDSLGGAICTWHGGYPGSQYLTYPDIIAQRVYSNGVTGGVVSMPNEYSRPGIIRLSAYPNPFKDKLKIEYSLPISTKVNISIYNILGQRVNAVLNSYQSAGSHVQYWDGKDYSGKHAAEGVYFLSLKTGTMTYCQKLITIR